MLHIYSSGVGWENLLPGKLEQVFRSAQQLVYFILFIYMFWGFNFQFSADKPCYVHAKYVKYDGFLFGVDA